jgi:beta-lactamase class A
MLFFHRDEALDQRGDQVLAATWAAFPGLAQNQIALTWIVYDEPVPVNTGGALTPAEFWRYGVRGYAYRGVEPIYPASVAKLFYLVAIQEWLDKGMISPSAEIERAIRDMIVVSGNDATSLVVDLLSGTTSGPELASEPFKTWQYQRNIVNRYFQELNWLELESINVSQKTWCEGAYGRERAALGEQFQHRNRLTTNATARLLHSIIGGVAVSSGRSQAMMALLHRSLDPEVWQADPKTQIAGFLGAGLPPTAQLWAKSGWMSQVRHDAAYIEIPGLRPYLLVVFSEGQAQSQSLDLLPFVSQQVAAVMQALG